MKRSLFFVLGLAASAAFSSSAFAQAFNMKNPEQMVASVDRLVGLSPDQKARVTEIVKRTVSELLTLSEADRTNGGMPIRERMRKEMREVLTPEQQRKYDRTPQMNGGGLTMMSPENKLARLDALVTLTPAQKSVALQIFVRELDTLLDIPEADRGKKGMDARQAARDEVRLILTPEQQKKYDTTPQLQGGGKMGGL